MASGAPVIPAPAGGTDPTAVAEEVTDPTRKSISQARTESVTLLAASAHNRQVEGAFRDIFWALICVCLPMIILTAIFIGLVYAHEVSNSFDTADRLAATLSSAGSGAYYYVNYSATRLITVSSWTSTVTSFTSTFIMALVSYPLTRTYVRRSTGGSLDSLPTVYQLRLIIGLLGGGFGALWSWIQYCFWRNRSKQTMLLWLAALSLSGAGILSFAILAVDTWLHVTTTTISYDAISAPTSTPAFSYGRDLLPDCYNESITTDGICIGYSGPGYFLFPSIAEVARTLMNLSTVNAALPCTVGNKSFGYLAAAQRDSDLDFQARTFAVRTECAPASKVCQLQEIDYCTYEICSGDMETASMAYNCSPSFYGDMTNSTGTAFNYTANGTSTGTSSSTGFFLQMFAKEAFSEPIGQPYSTLTPNPFYFTIGARVAAQIPLANDPEVVANQANGDSGIMFSCNATFYEMTYQVSNGTVVDANYTMVKNNTLPMNGMWAFAYYMAYPQNALEAAFISGAQQSNTSQQFADFIGQRFSETMLSMVAGITVESSNMAEQTREQLLVTRLPKAPFFALIVLNLLYALLGLLLAIIALASQPRRTRNIQARLGIGGLVAALLEPKVRSNTKARNSGIEGVFVEYYNDDKHHDDGRVIISTTAGNTVFEKVSRKTVATNAKAESVANSSQLSDHTLPRPLEAHTGDGGPTTLQSQTVSPV